ncbi:shikimate dehydrogenase [Castellaniella sp. MT123]|uniref:shikimate dehydrogenase n=1 Tax=Castellaniella sp. MT123 TaxID=3140381 RepID=UPI0031F3C4BC
MTDRYAIIGNPVAQSKSPILQMAFARQLGQDMSYETILATADTFHETVRRFIREGGKGMNVTAPFKLDALDLVDTLSDRARAAQAVNTLKFGDAGVYGDNTDGAGLVNDIQERLGFPLKGRRLLIIGAGGATRGIFLPLLETGPAYFLVVNRTDCKARAIVGDHAAPGKVEAGPIRLAEGGRFDVVINATSVSLTGDRLPLPEGIFAEGSLAYELAYNKGHTAFMEDATQGGAARISDGLGMLVSQAAEGFLLWRGVRPDISETMELLRNK